MIINRIPKQQDCVHPDFPNCTGGFWPWGLLFNSRCDVEVNREECGFDNDACTVYNKDYPECIKVVDDINNVADGRCHNYGEYNTEVCKFDGGDCGKSLPGLVGDIIWTKYETTVDVSCKS